MRTFTRHETRGKCFMIILDQSVYNLVCETREFKIIKQLWILIIHFRIFFLFVFLFLIGIYIYLILCIEVLIQREKKLFNQFIFYIYIPSGIYTCDLANYIAYYLICKECL